MRPEPKREESSSRNHPIAHATEQEISRFESEGGSTAPIAGELARPPVRGLRPRGSDQRGRILILFATRQDHTRLIADALARRLRSHGFTVEIGDTNAGVMPPPQDYDVVTIGAPMISGHESRQLGDYVATHRDALERIPSAMFLVSESGEPQDHAPTVVLEQCRHVFGWQPGLAAAFAGGVPAPRDGILSRLARWLGYRGGSRLGGAHPTDWHDVERFADAIATELAGAAITAGRTEPHSFGD